MNRNAVAVDGPAAAGKSVCGVLAGKLGFALLETGPIYRVITLMLIKAEIALEDCATVACFVEENIPRIGFSGNQLTLDRTLIGQEIRTPFVSSATPKVAKQPMVRRLIVPLQRTFNGGANVVAEGRDIGSVIFPDARVKIFLTAAPEVRAQRRLNQYRENGSSSRITFQEVLADIIARDQEDQTWADSPLVCLPDVVVIDSTYLNKGQVIELMLRACR